MAIKPPQLTVSDAEYDGLAATLKNDSGDVPLAARFRALFTLRAIGSHKAIDIIGQGFSTSGALLGHELAYCLGQMANPHALPVLEAVLENKKEHPMVRHEAAEAMGAIGSAASLPILKRYLADEKENVSVRETCEIALAKIEHDNGVSPESNRSIYDSIDPAPPTSMHDTTTTSTASTSQLRSTLLDTTQSLFARYRAMFALRNLASSSPTSQDPIDALAAGFSDTSALFRHEIAYVFGQLCSPLSVEALIRVLEDEKEEEMVRHEAAEALGGIGGDDDGSLDALRVWAVKEDVPRVVRESCEVALDMWERERDGKFESVEESIRKAGRV